MNEENAAGERINEICKGIVITWRISSTKKKNEGKQIFFLKNLQEFYFKNTKCSRWENQWNLQRKLELPEEDPAGRKRWCYALGGCWVIDETMKEWKEGMEWKEWQKSKNRGERTESMEILWQWKVPCKIDCNFVLHLITKANHSSSHPCNTSDVLRGSMIGTTTRHLNGLRWGPFSRIEKAPMTRGKSHGLLSLLDGWRRHPWLNVWAWAYGTCTIPKVRCTWGMWHLVHLVS